MLQSTRTWSFSRRLENLEKSLGLGLVQKPRPKVLSLGLEAKVVQFSIFKKNYFRWHSVTTPLFKCAISELPVKLLHRKTAPVAGPGMTMKALVSKTKNTRLQLVANVATHASSQN